jgi:chromosome segregation ATPase
VQGYLSENEILRQEKIEYLRSRKQTHENPMDPLQADLIRDLNQKLEILMAENAMIAEQKALLSQELENSAADLQRRTQEVEELAAHLRAGSEAIAVLQQRLAQTEKERDEAAKQAVSFSDALGKATSEIEQLKEALKLQQLKNREVEQIANEASGKLKQLTEKYEEEQLEAMRRVKRAEDRVRELHNQLLTKTQELDSLSETSRKLKREYASTRADAEGMVQVMSALQRQVAEYAEREEDVNKLSKESKELIEEALSAKDQALVREEQCKRDLNRLLEERTRLAVKRQADIDAAVDNARQRAAEQFQALDKDLKEMAEKNALLKGE